MLTASAALHLFQLKRRRNVNVLIFVQVLQKKGVGLRTIRTLSPFFCTKSVTCKVICSLDPGMFSISTTRYYLPCFLVPGFVVSILSRSTECWLQSIGLSAWSTPIRRNQYET